MIRDHTSALFRALKLGWLMMRTAPRDRVRIRRLSGRGTRSIVYRSDGSRFPVVLLHGLTRTGENDRRLVDFSMKLALCGFTVHTPRLAGLADLSLDRRDISTVVRTVEAASGPPNGRVGVIGFSLGGTYGLLAACDGRISGKVSFLCAAGAYYSLTDLVDHAFDIRRTEPYPVLAFSRKHLDKLGLAPGEIRLYHGIMDRYCEREGHFTGEETALIRKIVSDPRQAAIRRAWRRTVAVAGMDIERFRRLHSLQAEVLLLHFQADRVIPASDTLSIAERLKACGKKPVTWISRGRGHVNFKDSGPAGLLRTFYRISLLSAGGS